MAETPSSKADLREIGERIRLAVQGAGGNAIVSEKSGVPVGTINNYIAAKSEPSVLKLAAIAKVTNHSIDYFLTGRDPPTASDFELIPLYDIRLSAGAGAWNERARIIEMVPFTRAQILAIPGRRSTKDLALLRIRGDSGGDRLPDGALAMADTADNQLADGLFAFVQDDNARVKRFQVLMSGITLMSDNKTYPDEHVDYDQMQDVSIIGRVVWCGAPL
ncbi:putative HTH-type transcriptional regulator [Alphaproteobacteria bacterium SO-S41]|nr:putative HTH-type transcriptional regulator [Alphaproteobacteria bacterium SO-S41]